MIIKKYKNKYSKEHNYLKDICNKNIQKIKKNNIKININKK